MKKNFLTGLAILIPIALTYTIVLFLINLFTTPFLALFDYLIGHAEWSGHLHSRDIAGPIYKFLILLVLPLVIIATGFFGRVFFVKWIFSLLDNVAYRIPVINGIYKSVKDTVHAILEPQSDKFSGVVLVPFPHPKTYTIGFVLKDEIAVKNEESSSEMQTVIIPGTPTLTAAYMQMFKKKELIYLEMSVDEALKAVLSCGLILKDLNLKSDVTGNHE